MSGTTPRFDCRDCSMTAETHLSDPEAAVAFVGRSAWSHARHNDHTVDVFLDDSTQTND